MHSFFLQVFYNDIAASQQQKVAPPATAAATALKTVKVVVDVVSMANWRRRTEQWLQPSAPVSRVVYYIILMVFYVLTVYICVLYALHTYVCNFVDKVRTNTLSKFVSFFKENFKRSDKIKN